MVGRGDVVGGVGVDNQVSDFDGPGVLPLSEGGVQFDVALGTHPLARESYHVVIIWHHLGLGYPHGLESFLVEDIYQTFLVHEGLPYGESVYVDRYHHRVVLLAIVYAFEVVVRERDGWHPRSECHRVYLVYRPEVFLPGVVRASSPGKAAGYSVDNLSVTSPVGLLGGSSLRGGSALAGCRSPLLSWSFRPR